MDFNFLPDDQLHYAAQRYAEDAVENAAKLGVALDYSLESLAGVEKVLTQLHEKVSGYSPEELSILVRQFGSYVGEVLLRQAAGDWGVVEMASGERVAGIELEDRNLTLWPWAKVHKRLTEGAKENLQDYAENVLGLRQGQTT